ncbi:MAG: hypothetical protein EHM61_02870 [Acidobacteria bacterium]|nr:MAG: hypothetical protein EHM61_02870 [Acidobacteriota bacterium]
MLQSLDILIGLALVMLLVSMAVTMLTQALIVLLGKRGAHLFRGIADLLQQVYPEFTRGMAEEIAKAVLKHPLIRGSRLRYGDVVKREELTHLLLQFASDDSPELGQQERGTLRLALERNGISNPDATLSSVRSLALELERTNPELANTARRSLALLHGAGSDFLAKINAWFDQTMDRVSERFTVSARILTLITALAITCLIQLDTVSLINRLSIDTEMRNKLVERASGFTGSTPPGDPGGGNPNLPQIRAYFSILSEVGLLKMPAGWQDWKDNWASVNPVGLLISVLLLSLGAPFWYYALSRLLQLRSILARKEDVDRQDRESTQATVTTPVGPAPVSPTGAAGERGDLAAVV